MLIAVKPSPRIVWGESEDTSGDQRRVSAANVDECMMRCVVQQAPHVGAPAAKIEDAPENLVDPLAFRVRAVIGIVSNVEGHEELREAVYQEHADDREWREPTRQ